MNGGSLVHLFLYLVRGGIMLFFMNRNMALGSCRIKYPIGSVLRINSVPARQNNVRKNDVPYHRAEFSIFPLVDEVGRLAVVQSKQSRCHGR